MNVTLAGEYARFVERAANALIGSGAQDLLPPDGLRATAPPWAQEWDRVLLVNAPGAGTLYAFTVADQANLDALGAQVNRLVSGLAQRGILRGAPVRLVTVAAFPMGVDPRTGRKVVRLAPSEYVPGLRPTTWAVDLARGEVHMPWSFNKPEGADVVQQAARNVSTEEGLESRDVGELQRMHLERTQAFYQMMQGRQPYVTYALIAINVGVYLALFGAGSPTVDALVKYGALVPRLVQHGDWWRLFTSMFLHGSVTHILFNMVSLFAVGTLAERFYGSAKFLGIYLGSGLIAALTSFGWAVAQGNLAEPAVGASGAIFGIVGALVTLRFQTSEVIPASLRQRISSSMLVLVAINFAVLYFVAYVDNAAHVGGLIGGMALSFLLPVTKRAAVSS